MQRRDGGGDACTPSNLVARSLSRSVQQAAALGRVKPVNQTSAVRSSSLLTRRPFADKKRRLQVANSRWLVSPLVVVIPRRGGLNPHHPLWVHHTPHHRIDKCRPWSGEQAARTRIIVSAISESLVACMRGAQAARARVFLFFRFFALLCFLVNNPSDLADCSKIIERSTRT